MSLKYDSLMSDLPGQQALKACHNFRSPLPCQQALEGVLQLQKSLTLVQNQLLVRTAHCSNRQGWWEVRYRVTFLVRNRHSPLGLSEGLKGRPTVGSEGVAFS
jgi:hypothetical protein